MSAPSFTNSKRYIVVLKLARLSVPTKIERARNYVFKMTANPAFPTPVPELGMVGEAANMLELAWEQAQDGSRTQTQMMYQRESELDNLLIELGHYVEDRANDEVNPPAIITSAGMDYKSVPFRQARVFTVRNGSLKGNVIAYCPSAGNRASYLWQYRLKGAAAWILYATTLRANVLFSGLSSGSTYEFRVASVTKAGQSDFTDELELVIL